MGEGAASELTRRIANGDPAAFAAFYEQWFDAAFVLARTASRRDESFCLDVVQDVMLRVADRMPPLADDAAVGAWMSRTVYTAVLDRLRGERRRQRREQAVAARAADARAAPADGAVLADEQRGWLLQKLAALPAADRALVEARFGTAATVAAAGREFGWSDDAAHGRLRRVLGRLRRAAREWFDDG
jgi:RNA polymerase sigma factor (sigma-70 family)